MCKIQNFFALSILAFFVISSEGVAAYTIEGGGVCSCTSCSDCMNALNDNTNCYNQVKLTADIIDQPENCIDNPENFSNKIFDCQGHIIDGTESNYNGINFNQKNNNTIKNCVIKEFENGIYLYSSSNNTLINNTANNNWGWAGILLYYCSNNIIINNIANNSTEGIRLDSSPNNVLINNTAYNNSNGIALYDSSNSTLINNTAYNNNANGIGISGGDNNTLTNNTVYNNINGISLWSSSNSTIIDNIIYNNYRGIYLTSSNNSAISSNTLYNNSNYGIYSVSSLSNNLTNNNISSNQYGIYLDYSNYTVINNNNISLSKKNGIVVLSSLSNTITSNTFRDNGAVTYMASNSPRAWAGTDWSDTLAGDNTGFFVLYPPGTYSPTLVTADDTAIYVDGSYNLSLALINGSMGNSTLILASSVASNCQEMETYLSNLGYPATCNYFEPNVWLAASGSDYVANFNSSTTVVSGFTTPPTIKVGISPESAAILLNGSSNTVGSNYFYNNSLVIYIVNPANTISGDNIDITNRGSIAGNLTGLSITNLRIGSSPANYNLSRSDTTLYVSNTYGNIQWSIANLSISQNLASNLYVGQKFVSLNPSKLSALNTTAVVEIKGVDCQNFELYHYSGFTDNLSQIVSYGTKMADKNNINGNCTDSSICRNVQCQGSTLSFEAQHFDSFGVYSAPAQVLVTVATTVSISLPISSIDFGSMNLGSSDNTTDGSPAPFVIQNDGSVAVNVTVNATQLWSGSGATGTSSYYQFLSAENESGSVTDPNVDLVLSWTDMPIATTAVKVVDRLGFTDTADAVNVHIKVTVPSDEPAGVKSSTVIFTAIEA